MKYLSRRFILICASGLASLTVNADMVDEAQRLLDAGQADAAYSLLATQEIKHAGDNRFDYLLGIAALDSGHTTESTFALERVVVSHPQFAGARLDLARAYFKLGNFQAAKTEFSEVLSVNPPAGIRQVVDSYLAQTEQRLRDAERVFSNRLEFTLGYDNNINTATAAETVTGFGSVPLSLSQASRQQSSAYAQVNLKSTYLRPLNAEWQGFIGGGIKHKEVPSLGLYDSSDLSIQGGLQRKYGDRQLAFGAQVGRFYLAHQLNYIYLSSYLNWQQSFQNNKAFNLFIRHMRVDYNSSRDKADDFRQILMGIGGLLEKPRYTLWINTYGGIETALDTEDADGDRDIFGFSANIGVPLRHDLIWRGNLGWQQKQYQATNPIFGVSRHEHYYTAGFEFDWRASPVWGVVGKYLYTHNDANLALYNYERSTLSFTLYRSF